MKDALVPWLEIGYSSFAEKGPDGIRIERLAKKTGKNKSSFYHHFAEKEIFISRLIEYHTERAFSMIKKESECATPNELIDVLLDHKEDLFFNRQLRIHRNNAEFQQCISKIDEYTFRNMGTVWGQMLGLQDNSYLSLLVFKLSLDNFYLRVTPEVINSEFLENYFMELKKMIQEFRKEGRFS